MTCKGVYIMGRRTKLVTGMWSVQYIERRPVLSVQPLLPRGSHRLLPLSKPVPIPQETPNGLVGYGTERK
jgi:hypothetical protein